MKLVLVAPPTEFDFPRPMPSLALGVLTAAAQHAGIEVDPIDCNLVMPYALQGERQGTEELDYAYLDMVCSRVALLSPDIVGISAWGVSIPFALALAEALKGQVTSAPIIVGGIHDSDLARMLIRASQDVDAVVVGDGELVLAPLSRHLNGDEVEPPPGVILRADGSVADTGSPVAAPIDCWPIPSYPSFADVATEPGRFLFETSRGCPYRCAFCCVNSEGFRQMGPHAAVSRLGMFLDKYGLPSFSFSDNFFPLSGRRTEEMCELIVADLPGIRWSCSSRADTVSIPMMQRMADAGCDHVFLGVESINPRTLEYISKTTSVDGYLDGLSDRIRGMAATGIAVRVSTIIGFPHETREEMERTVAFVKGLVADGVDAYAGPPVVYPGSLLWQWYRSGDLEVVPVHGRGVHRNHAGCFGWRYDHSPWFVPNAFRPRNEHVSDKDMELLLREWLMDIDNTRRSNPKTGLT